MVTLHIGFEFTTKRKTFVEALLRRPITLSASGCLKEADQMTLFCIKTAMLNQEKLKALDCGFLFETGGVMPFI